MGGLLPSLLGPFLLAIPFYGATSVLTDATRGFKHTKYVVYVKNVAIPTLTLISAIIAVFVFDNFRTFVYGYVFAFMIGYLLAILSLIQGIDVDIMGPATYPISTTRKYAFPMMAITGVGMLFSKTDILMLGLFASSKEIGWYQAAFTTAVILTIVTEAATSIFPSLAAELHANGKHQRLKEIYQGIVKWISSLTLAGALGVGLFAEDVMIVFGIYQSEAITTLIILTLAQLFAVVTGPAALILKMTGRERLMMYTAGAMLPLNIVLNYILIPQYGVVGAAVATGFSLAAINAVKTIQLWYLMDITPYSATHWRGLIPVVMTIPVMLLVRQNLIVSPLRITVAAISSLSVYAIAVYVVGLDKSDEVLFKELN
jgi:O-antigen/teichoic acid export membrane protein